ncbi:MAG: hypothetical protein GY822_21345 [Deltaproteobacteria bacterium]|nr:hypothetical protein [Deltaproteobacteria bacterium]
MGTTANAYKKTQAPSNTGFTKMLDVTLENELKKIKKQNKTPRSRLFKYAHQIESLWVHGFSWQLISDWLRANKRILITRVTIQQYMYRTWKKENRLEIILAKRKSIKDENKKSDEANKAVKLILG